MKKLLANIYKKYPSLRRLLLHFGGNAFSYAKGNVEIETFPVHCEINLDPENSLIIRESQEKMLEHFHLSITGTGNKIEIDPYCRLNTALTIIISGNNNKIKIGENVKFNGNHCSFKIKGNSCRITLGEHSKFQEDSFLCLDDGSSIAIEKFADVNTAVEFASFEGKQISIGSSALIARDVEIRNSDSHSILDNVDNRVNPAKDIFIGDRVWIGRGALILKGASIQNDSVISARAVVTKAFLEPGLVLVGIPAQKKKESIHWTAERIKTRKQ